MREVKFRAKSMNKKDNRWHYGLIRSIAEDGTGFIQEQHKNCIHINTDTIGQYTGLLDFNGVEVYEGDIVKLIEDRNRDGIFEPFIAGQVKFRNGSFYITDGAISRFRWEDYVVEVVGNIYESPELLDD